LSREEQSGCSDDCYKSFFRGDGGSVLVETALTVAVVLLVATPFAAVIAYAGQTAHDLATVHAAVRELTRSQQLPHSTDVTFTCGTAPERTAAACDPVLTRGTYVEARRNTTISFPFGLSLSTNARAVGRVG